MSRVIVDKVRKGISHPWHGSVVSINGVQYAPAVNTVAAATNVVINTMPFGDISTDYPAGGRGTLKEVLFGITVGLKARQSANAIMQFFLQGREQGPPDHTWVDLSSVETNIPGTSLTDVSLQGYGQLQTNFNKIPFEIRAQYQCNQTNEGYAQIKNSSYVKWLYEID